MYAVGQNLGMAPGTSEPQYKVLVMRMKICNTEAQVCEIASVGKYKHAYSFGEFETTKALMLRIGRNQRLWRMNVISNHRSQIYVSWLEPVTVKVPFHRFADGELRESSFPGSFLFTLY